jgi:lipoate-protein ligase A
MKWRVLLDGKLSAAENMAIDEAIMQAISEGKALPTLRFYDWKLPTVSYGYNQEIAKQIDLQKVKDKGYDYVRRPTGGRAVLHHEEITYAVISPLKDHLQGSIIESYASISKALKRGLALLGIEVDFEKGSVDSHQQRKDANPCFSSSSRYELSYQNRKIVGSAQVRKNDVLLQHGSILLNRDQSGIAEFLPNISEKDRKRMASFFSRKTICINNILENSVSFDQAVERLKSGFMKEWKSCEFETISCLSYVERQIKNSLKTKYLTDEWNIRK